MSARILIIEDNLTNLARMCFLVLAAGHEPVGVQTGARAVEEVCEQKPDLIVSDVKHLETEGRQFIQYIKSNPEFQHIPILAASGLRMIRERDSMLDAGCDGYISKPFDSEQFLRELSRYLPESKRRPIPSMGDNGRLNPPHRWNQTYEAKVFVLCDATAERDVFRGVLEPFGYQVFLFENISDAIARAKRDRPSLVISEMVFGHESGLSLVKTMQGEPELASIPTIITGRTHDGMRSGQLARESGAALFLEQPFQPLALRDAVKSVIDGKR